MEEVIFSDIAYYTRLTTIGMLAATGFISNGISLSFFLKHQRESLADRHLIALNITDLLICCLSPVALFCTSNHTQRQKEIFYSGDMRQVHFKPSEYVIGELFYSFSLLSCFTTTMLSVTRSLALSKPLYRIRKEMVYFAHSINMVFLIGLTSTKMASFYNMMLKQEGSYSWRNVLFAIYSTMYLIQNLYVLITTGIVGVSSVLVARALRQPPEILAQQEGRQNNATNRKATIMILTLSIIFVILNGTWCVYWVVSAIIYAYTGDEVKNVGDNIMIGIFGTYLNGFLMTINSCANPVVYILRNSRLNGHTKSLLKRLTTFLKLKTENAIDNM